MIRVYLTVKNRVDEIINDIDSMIIKSSSVHYDNNSDNVMIIIEGYQADLLNEYMLPPALLSTGISTLPEGDIDSVTLELQGRGIITKNSVTVEDLLNNILRVFDSAHSSLGDISYRDFS